MQLQPCVQIWINSVIWLRKLWADGHQTLSYKGDGGVQEPFFISVKTNEEEAKWRQPASIAPRKDSTSTPWPNITLQNITQDAQNRANRKVAPSRKGSTNSRLEGSETPSFKVQRAKFSKGALREVEQIEHSLTEQMTKQFQEVALWNYQKGVWALWAMRVVSTGVASKRDRAGGEENIWRKQEIQYLITEKHPASGMLKRLFFLTLTTFFLKPSDVWKQKLQHVSLFSSSNMEKNYLNLKTTSSLPHPDFFSFFLPTVCLLFVGQ